MQVKATEPYVAPESKIVTVRTGRICELSNYGSPGQAGGAGSFGEEGSRF